MEKKASACGTIYGATLASGGGHLVRVETCLGRGLSRILLVGMPDTVAKEARERLPAAFARHDLEFPRGKILFNLVPAQLPKAGLPFDLALAVSLVCAHGRAPRPQEETLFLAELDLEGKLRSPARGTLLAALAAAKHSCLRVITAPQAAKEAALVPQLQVFAAEDLGQVLRYLKQEHQRHKLAAKGKPVPETEAVLTRVISRSGQDGERVVPSGAKDEAATGKSLSDLRGQEQAHRAAHLAMAGRLNLWLEGPPGTGKSMLARRLSGLRPPLSTQQSLELAQVEALLGPVPALPHLPPFRAPHASASMQALLGGGRPLRPGELARAHGGILFLDEIPEFARPALECLRQPLEEREVRLQRAQEWARFPADILLVATSNPCPCGYLGHPHRPCTCSEAKLKAYRGRLSGPLRDRFDLFVRMDPVSTEILSGPPTACTEQERQSLLQVTRDFQQQQQAKRGFLEAADASMEQLQQTGIATQAQQLLRQANARLHLSGRGVVRCLRCARAAADLRQSISIEQQDLREALSLRPLPAEAQTTTGSLPWKSRATRRPPTQKTNDC